jgi:hypothetical protein
MAKTSSLASAILHIPDAAEAAPPERQPRPAESRRRLVMVGSEDDVVAAETHPYCR